MPDKIHLLPDAVANQIAAGEVVQRPASVVKELMENAIDAGATQIKLVVKDAGKTLIQVIDNGSGMSDTDSRMCFERHATSKIKKAEDLFHIVTKGFRGEALASIAAIAQVEMRTRLSGAELGTIIEIEGSKVKSQEPGQTSEGTNFMVRNLFYNVPARRYFLKSDAIELRHIIDEFQRVALTHPDIEFSFHHNGAEVFLLPPVLLRQRIVHVMGTRYNEKLVPVDESTDIVSVSGFIGKPEVSKKTRGEQFFFVNNRFIRSAYLHHAVMAAFDNLLPSGNFPLYILYLTIDPEQIDINIHPTKTEIKFQDERAIYAILHAAIKRALGKFNIAPSLDFEQETAISVSPLRTGQDIQIPHVKVNPDFNPFESKPVKESPLPGWFEQRERNADGWKELMAISDKFSNKSQSAIQPDSNNHHQFTMSDLRPEDDYQPFQLHRKYIACQAENGLILIDQQRGHRRILFEKYLLQLEQGKGLSQQILFPEEVKLPPADYAIAGSSIPYLHSLGFEVKLRPDLILEVSGIPADAPSMNITKVIEEILGQLKNEYSGINLAAREKMAWICARNASISYGQMLTTPEMKELVNSLFACKMPYTSEHNKPTVLNLELQTLEQQFR
jgi:DNA mismatch repair protein MutL